MPSGIPPVPRGGKRMRPAAQSNARADLEAELANAMTGIPEVDSLNAAEVRRRFLFGVPSRGQAPTRPQAPNPLMQLLSSLFGGRR